MLVACELSVLGIIRGRKLNDGVKRLGREGGVVINCRLAGLPGGHRPAPRGWRQRKGWMGRSQHCKVLIAYCADQRPLQPTTATWDQSNMLRRR